MQGAQAENFKSSQFLAWPQDNQGFYLRTSIGMASLIAAQNNKSQSKCIDDWYFSKMKERDFEIAQVMRKYPNYHPRAVILAVLKKACGSFTY